MMNPNLQYHPTVFPVESDYQILFLTQTDGIGWIEIAGQRYTDEECGLLHYGKMHKIPVDGGALNEAKAYTVVFVEYKEKPVYFPKGEEVIRETYAFTPVTGENFHLFQFADTHGAVDVPLENFRRYEETYGKVDLLCLNGDINDSSASVDHFKVSFALASGAVAGTKPVIYARGNHDTRGAASELLPGYSPTAFRGGRRESFWSFRQGGLWGLVLDCGEDKYDHNIEYGGTILFENFRKREAEYLRSLIAHKDTEYAAPGVTKKVAFCHVPFVEVFNHPFDVGTEIYKEWIALLDEIGIDLLLCGHMHACYVIEPHAAGKKDAAFPVFVSSLPVHPANSRVNDKPVYTGAALVAADSQLTAWVVEDGVRRDPLAL